MPEPSAPILRIIYPVGHVWFVSANETDNGFTSLPSRSDAIRAVRAELKASPGGGEIRVLTEHGKVVSRGFVAGSSVAGAPAPSAAAREPAASPKPKPGAVIPSPTVATPNPPAPVRNAVKWSFKAYNWAFTILGIFAPGTFAILTSGAVTSGFGSPVGVFIATFAWSAGIAAAFWWIRSQELTGWPAAIATVLCLIAASLVASLLGLSSLDPGTAPGNPLEIILRYAQSAMNIYGIAGFIAGTGAGLYYGWEVSRWYASNA